jgi:hypothetical protein
LCLTHDPSTKDEREAGRVKAGKNSSRAARLEKLVSSRLRPTFELLETATKDVYAGRLDPRQASAMASLASAMVKVIKAGQEEAGTEIPPQFIMDNLEEFYADLRVIHQGMPRPAGCKPHHAAVVQFQALCPPRSFRTPLWLPLITSPPPRASTYLLPEAMLWMRLSP